MTELLTIGQLARRSGVAASAIRFYEARGLVPALRNASGHRRFHRASLRRIAFVVFAQKLGLTLDEIREELDRLPTDRVPTGADWSALSGRWVRRIDARIEELERLRHSLGECIACGCLSLETCALVNPGDRAAAGGAGPRRWRGEGER